MTRRQLASATSLVVLALLVVLASRLPVPYVVETPGPTTDTLSGNLIEISGHQTYPTSGALRLTTVSSYGGPGRHLDLLTAMRAWVSPHDAVLPEELLYPRGTTRQQAQHQDAEAMTLSQQDATTAALRQLHIAVTPVVVVQAISAGMPAQGRLKASDQITSIDGTAVGGSTDLLRKAITAHKAGDTLHFVVQRAGATVAVDVVATQDNSDPENLHRTVVGFSPAATFSFPFTIKIRLDDVGGPSAGLMFALGIVDKLTPGALTGGAKVAGTGTIDTSGAVGAIGGIPQKMAGARSAGATVFLSPEQNCAEARPVVPKGLRLVKVTSLASAIAALDDVRAGNLAALPRC